MIGSSNAPDAKQRCVVIVGIRSHYIKLAAIQRAIDLTDDQIEWIVVDTGQHYDQQLAAQYHNEYQLRIDVQLRCGKQHLDSTQVLARTLVHVEAYLRECCPKGVLVFGDANSSLAGGLAARRLGIPVAHLEAGVRTGAETAEELNRVLLDAMSSLHLAVTRNDLEYLISSGHSNTAHFTGDVVRDLCVERNIRRAIKGRLTKRALVTIHRAENTRDTGILRNILTALDSTNIEPLLVLHPRVARLLESDPAIQEIPYQVSVGHSALLDMIIDSDLVVTDSGALQRESYYLGRRAVVIQENPFWQSLVDAGFHIAVAPNGDLVSAILEATAPPPKHTDAFGSAPAAPLVVDRVREWLLR